MTAATTSRTARPTARREWSTPAWTRIAPVALLLVVVTVRTLRPIEDPDTWWHLRAGQELARRFELVGPDPWSPFTTHEWIRHQWLGELLLAGVHAVGGVGAVAWLVTVFALVTVLACYVVARRQASVLVSTAVALAAFVGASMTVTPRPQSLSLPLAVLAAHGWTATAQDGRVRWWLVPLTWVWACCHGFWFVSPVLGGVVVVGLLLERAPRALLVRTAAATVASLAVAALTPVGPRLLAAPFEVGRITALIEEWQPPTRDLPAFVVTVAMALLLVALRSRGPLPSWPEVGVLGLAAYLVVSHGRTVSLAAVLLVPLLAPALERLVPFARERIGRPEVLTLGVAAVVAAAASAALVTGAVTRPAGFPTALAGPLTSLPRGSVVCNDYDAGGWLWWAHPGLVPVIDGRTELYDARDVEDYARFAAGGPGTTSLAERRGCAVALVRAGSPAQRTLVASGWGSPSQADGWVLLRRGTAPAAP